MNASISCSFNPSLRGSTSAAMTVFLTLVGLAIVAIGGLLVSRQRCGGLTLRQATKVGFDRVCAAASKSGKNLGGHRGSAGLYHPMGEHNMGLGSGA